MRHNELNILSFKAICKFNRKKWNAKEENTEQKNANQTPFTFFNY